MPLRNAFAMLAVALVASACQPAPDAPTAAPAPASSDAAPAERPPSPTPPPQPAASAESGGAAATADAYEPTPTAAEARVRAYYTAINARDYAAAYAIWSNDGAASGQDFVHFRDGYADTESVSATVGRAYDLEGAAGSRYILVPVELTAKQRDGSVRRYQGRFTLRAAVADGASEQQRHWHLQSAEITRLPDQH